MTYLNEKACVEPLGRTKARPNQSEVGTGVASKYGTNIRDLSGLSVDRTEYPSLFAIEIL
jgi:hypothetical protein